MTRERRSRHRVDGHGAETDEHRRARIAERIESGREKFDGGVSRKAWRVAPERDARLMRIEGREAPVLINDADHAFAEQEQADGGRNGQKKTGDDGAREDSAECREVMLGGAFRDTRESGGS